jgi:hypothetical protein
MNPQRLVEKLKGKIRNTQFAQEMKELEEAMKNAAKIKKYNGVMASILKQCFNELKKVGITQVKYEWKGKMEICKFDQDEKDINELIKEGYIEK